MISLSAALHGLLLIGVPGKGVGVSLPMPEDLFVSMIKMIKVGTKPPTNVPDRLPEKTVEKAPEPSEPSLEPQPEISPVQEVLQEAVNHEEMREDEGVETGKNKEAQGSSNYIRDNEGVPEGGATQDREDREYEALLAHIKDFINKNLVYPPMARRRNIQGIVGVSFEIDGNGVITSITVDNSSGRSVLDNAATSLIKKMRLFENMTIKRKLTFRVNIEYKLTEQ
jgi:protein TonB